MVSTTGTDLISTITLMLSEYNDLKAHCMYTMKYIATALAS